MPSTAAATGIDRAEPIEGYRLGARLGSGGAGEVWRTEAPGGIAKAIKLLPMAGGAGLAERELAGLRTVRAVRHPYLLAIDRFEVVGDTLVIVMELADGSLADSLRQRPTGLPRGELLDRLAEAAEVLDLLADRYRLYHLDVKPSNLLLSADHVKVADFGLVTPTASESILGPQGVAFSPGYAPPELAEGRIGDSTDPYALAVTYQELLTGQRPFSGRNVIDLICTQQRTPPSLTGLPQTDREILRRALHPDPQRRFQCCREIVHALRQPSTYQVHMPVPGRPSRTPAAGGPTGAAAKAAAAAAAVRTQLAAEVPDRIHADLASAPPAGKPLQVKEVSGSTRSHALLAPGAGPPRSSRSAPAATPVTDLTPLPSRRLRVPRGFMAAGADLRFDAGRAVANFRAALPAEIFALKLRGLAAACGAELKVHDANAIDLVLRPQGQFGLARRHWTIAIVVSPPPRSHALHGVEVAIRSAEADMLSEAAMRRAGLLLRLVKAHLMADDDHHQNPNIDAGALHAQLWQG